MKPVNISYSALSDWELCPFYYKLVNIERLKKFVKNIYTYHGTLSHEYVQGILLKTISKELACEKFSRQWEKMCGIYSEYLKDFDKNKHPTTWTASTIKVFDLIEEAFSEQFKNYEILSVEEKLHIQTDFPQKFKGYIDIVLKLENGDIVIPDFKNCHSSYLFNKYRDKFKDYQLILYKYFYSKKYGIPLEKIHTFFITLERSKSSKNPITFIEVGSTRKKVENALGWLTFGLKAINANLWLKKKSSCCKFGEMHPCAFYKSKHCP